MRLAMIQMSNSGSVEKNMEKRSACDCRSSRKGSRALCCSGSAAYGIFPQYLGRDVSS